MKAVIIDDEKEARRNLLQMLKQYCPSVTVVGEAGSVREGVELIRNVSPDGVLLDIQMQDGSGFDLLMQFPEPDFHVVFVTAYDQFAIRAFEFNAVDYLLKPIDKDRLIKAIQRIEQLGAGDDYFRQLSSLLANVRGRPFETITLQTQEGHHYVPLGNIIRLESDKNYTTFHCSDRKTIIISDTIKKFENILPLDQFFRTHQSHIVHRKFVKSYIKSTGGSIEMIDGFHVPVARRKKDAFFLWMRG